MAFPVVLSVRYPVSAERTHVDASDEAATDYFPVDSAHVSDFEAARFLLAFKYEPSEFGSFGSHALQSSKATQNDATERKGAEFQTQAAILIAKIFCAVQSSADKEKRVIKKLPRRKPQAKATTEVEAPVNSTGLKIKLRAPKKSLSQNEAPDGAIRNAVTSSSTLEHRMPLSPRKNASISSAKPLVKNSVQRSTTLASAAPTKSVPSATASRPRRKSESIIPSATSVREQPKSTCDRVLRQRTQSTTGAVIGKGVPQPVVPIPQKAKKSRK